MNQREIKFKISDRTRDELVARLSFGDDGAVLTILAEPARIGDFYSSLVHGESAILVQFTGLKDKNEKEIYEGDVAKSFF